MNSNQYLLAYAGYWRETAIKSIPAQSGVYSVYVCRTNTAKSAVSLRRLIYIGESKNVRVRLSKHEKWDDWRRHLNSGEELCFNFAPIRVDRERVEAALIHHHRPLENTEYANSFPFPHSAVSTSGKNKFLDSLFNVNPKGLLGAFGYR